MEFDVLQRILEKHTVESFKKIGLDITEQAQCTTLEEVEKSLCTIPGMERLADELQNNLLVHGKYISGS